MTVPLLATKSLDLYGRGPRTPHISVSNRGKSGELQQLRDDMEAGFLMVEGKVAHPVIQRVTPDELDHAGANATMTVLGRGFIPPGWRQAHVNIDPAGANNGLEWTAVQPGDDGDSLYVEYVNNGGATLVTCVNTNNNGAITAPNILTSATLAARAIHVGSEITITGSANGNNGVYKIIGVTSATVVRVSPNFVAAEGAGFVWTHQTNVVTVSCNLAGGAVTALAVIAGLAASADGAMNLVMARNIFPSTGAGFVAVAVAATALSDGEGSALRCAQVTMGTAANSGIIWKARFPGLTGEQVSVTYRTGLGGGLLPVITLTGFDIDVFMLAGATTAANILQAMERSDARHFVEAIPVYNSNNTGLPGALAVKNLIRGADGTAVRATAGGLDGTIRTVTDGTIVMAFAALAASAADEFVDLEINICGNQFHIQQETV